ncbi:hypothetical protein [Pseudoroseomonas cervicalis]|uniref:hypothetical protein n=1 Tax=Teichococcus cervicalis TaxID=204525 RepID=UPI0022F18DBC|nr:hypothetical protein [Pseudoroseomonas cervicalis]WBV43210.1 hypothetical protein PFY06_01170 [Pseudoroseomonas cervicalis]
MRHRLTATALLLAPLLLAGEATAQPAPPRLPGWSAERLGQSSGGITEDWALRCSGEGCAQGSLACTGFRIAATPGGPPTLPELADPQRAPIGQMGYWLSARLAQERRDILGPGDLRDTPLSGFVLESAGRREVALGRAALRSSRAQLGAVLALWPEGERLRGLRCSYRLEQQAEALTRIRSLLAALPGGR